MKPEAVNKALGNIGEEHYFKCPKCGEVTRVKVGQYL